LGELLDDRRAERVQVLRRAARRDVPVDHDLFVEHLGAALRRSLRTLGRALIRQDRDL
jgi:hypothetical protein